MLILPAVDMLGGKCVRLSQGRFDQVTVYFDDPAEPARRWVEEGARILHLVDLEGSRVGAPVETEAIRRIRAAVDVPLELGGGVRNLETARQILGLGVDRVIIGTSAALDRSLAEVIFGELGDRAVLGVDARDGFVAVKGWEETTQREAVEFAVEMQSLGARRVIYTDISRDGMLKGVNLSAMRRMAESLEIPVIASGGVSSLSDIEALRGLESVGVEGAILGKALYTGNISLAEALAAAE